MTSFRVGAARRIHDWVVICHTICQMRTTLDIDGDLLSALRDRHPDASKTEAIELAVRGYLNSSAADRLRELAGKIEIEDLSRELRSLDRGS